METERTQPAIDSAIGSLVIMLRLFDNPITHADLIHRLGKSEGIGTADILTLAREHLGYRARRRAIPLKHLLKQPLPAIIEGSDGLFRVLARIADGRYLVQDPVNGETLQLDEEAFCALYGGHLIFIGYRHASAGDDSHREFGLRWFVNEFMRDRGLIGQILIAALVVQLFALTTPLFTMVIIDKVFSSSGQSTLEVLIIGLLIIALFDMLTGGFRRLLLHHVSNKVDVKLAARLFRHITHLPISFFNSIQTGDTANRLKELESIRRFLTGSALSALIDFPFSLLFLLIMYLFNPLLAGIVVLAILLSLVLYGLVSPTLKERLQKNHQQTTDSHSFLVEALHTIKTIKSLSIEPQMQRQWENHVVSQSQLSSSTEVLAGHITQIAAFINKLTVAICLWIGAMAVLDGMMTAGQLIAFNMLVGRVMAPTQRIAQMLQQLHQVRVSIRRIAELFQVPTESALHSHCSTLPSLKGRVTLRGVGFSYAPGDPPVLEDIDLDIPAGQIVGISGHSGAGKSTLLMLLQRLYTPTRGNIYVDGVNLAEIDPSWLRRNIGVVLQDAQLLNRTIRENIALTLPGATMEMVEAGARLSGADEFVRALPRAYDTVVGEQGTRLSTGQRQRLVLARALINNPRILILDEATNALDAESELFIHRNMRQICMGRTVFIVAHRPSTLNIADRIIILEHGQVVEDGVREALSGSDSRYAAITSLNSLLQNQ